MNLEHEFTYVATLKPPVGIGAGPFGTRNFFEVAGGTVEGKRLKAKVLTGGGDWLLIGPDGYARLDVRAQFLTDDGASLYVHYTGLVQMNEKVADVVENAIDQADLAELKRHCERILAEKKRLALNEKT